MDTEVLQENLQSAGMHLKRFSEAVGMDVTIEDFDLFHAVYPVLGFYNPSNGQLGLNAYYAMFLTAKEVAGVAIHETIHASGIFDEGLTQFLTELAIRELGINSNLGAYPQETQVFKDHFQGIKIGFRELINKLQSPVEGTDDSQLGLIANFAELTLFGKGFGEHPDDYSYETIEARVKKLMPFINKNLSRAATAADGDMEFDADGNLVAGPIVELLVNKARQRFMEDPQVHSKVFQIMHNNPNASPDDRIELQAFAGELDKLGYGYLSPNQIIELYSSYLGYRDQHKDNPRPVVDPDYSLHRPYPLGKTTQHNA